jgi:hypothetical protein
MTLNDVGDLTLSKWYPTDRNEPPVINDGDLILVTGQTDKTENGLYYARIGTNWDRVTPERNSIIFNRYVNVENVGVFKLSFDIDDNSWTVGSPAAEFTYTLITYENYKKIQKPTLKLRTYWSSDSSISNLSNYTYHSIDFNSGTNYETVLIKPSWVGPVRSLYFEFSNLKNTGYNAKVQIDYISVLTNAGYYNVKKELTPVRIALSGDDRTDVRLWVGNFEDPIIEIDNFAIQETSGSYIRFGKLTPDDEASSWIWGSLRYHIGNVIPPVVPEQVGFYPSFRFPSVGGVRKIVQHAGTVWCLTDGYYNNATTDNPDDKIFKAWSYIPDKEIWKLESPIPNRISTTKGVTRALAAASYRNTLIVSGQVETIIDESIMPVENP